MRTFIQNKLWRDKMVSIVERRDNATIQWRQLNDQEFNQQIRVKLREEAEEVATAQSRDELLAELADLYEVIDALSAINNITKNDIITEQIKKRDERGGFDARTFVESSSHPAGSFGEQYCLANPTKYPEIK